MKKVFKYGKFDNTVWSISILILAITIYLSIWLFINRDDSYFAVWFVSIMGALFFLCLLAIPTRIVIEEGVLVLHCVGDITYIPLGKITSVKYLANSGLRGKICLGGVFGFFGYYGWYFDSKKWKFCTLYARSRKNLVEIKTLNRTYLVSCSVPKELVKTLIDNQ